LKVLLISENQCRENLIPYPLGTAYVAASVKDAGHKVAGLDLMFSEDPAGETARAVREFDPDCVGLSVRNIDNQDRYSTEFYMPPVASVVAAIRSETDAPIVLGGAGFTIFPLECLEYLGLELGVMGEGEVTFLRLLDCLAQGGDLSSLPGTALLRNGEGLVKAPGPAPDLETLPGPDRETFDVSRYNWVPGSGPPFCANIQSRRGCHMRCIYCSSPLLEGRTVRLRPPSRVADEMQSLEVEHGIMNVIFTDSLFNYPARYAERLCREIAGRGLGLRWTASFNPAYYNPDLFELMREAGCHTLSVGNESGSEDMLARLRKDFSREDILKTVRSARAAGLSFYCFLLLGGPGETRATVEESIGFLEELEPESVRVTVGIRIYPGCELHGIAIREGFVTPDQNLLYPAFYSAPEVEPWLYEHMRGVCRDHSGWIM
jgi:radical SAM superfamily enzyme YgiQ (UPF0313 family)